MTIGLYESWNLRVSQQSTVYHAAGYTSCGSLPQRRSGSHAEISNLHPSEGVFWEVLEKARGQKRHFYIYIYTYIYIFIFICLFIFIFIFIFIYIYISLPTVSILLENFNRSGPKALRA